VYKRHLLAPARIVNNTAARGPAAALPSNDQFLR
jgi:hypothetical protein